MAKTKAARKRAATAPALQATAWSLPHQTPARHGVYEIKADDGTPHQQFSYFDDAGWFAGATTPEDARQNARLGHLRHNQQVTWRGIVK